MKGETVSENGQDVNKKFEVAVQLVKSLPQSASFSPSYAEATKIYSYFKQSKFGPCSIPRPGFWDVVNRAKWDAWSALGNMPPEVAMKNYVEEIKKVYYRIKDIDAFEEKHVEFADVLIPFCQVTGTQMTSKLMEMLKGNKSVEDKDEEIHVNGVHSVNGISERDSLDYDHAKTNGVVFVNEIDDVEGPSESCNGDVCSPTEVCKVLKSVKFQISDGDEKENDVDEDHLENNGETIDDNILVNVHTQNVSFVKVNAEKINSYEKEEGELSSSENDSDDEEIYCDSLDPDQILDASKKDEGEDKSVVIVPMVDEAPEIAECIDAVSTEPPLFSPIHSTTTTFQDTAQNILTKTAEHSRSSSNNSRSDFELVDVTIDEKNDFQSVRKRDNLTAICTNEVINSHDTNLANHSKTVIKDEPSEKSYGSGRLCHVCAMINRKSGHNSNIRQSHSGNRSDNGGRNTRHGSSGNDSSRNQHTNSYHHNHRHHHHHHDNHHNRRSTSESNNGGSDEDSCSSLSSSSSDNVGLKIIKALERMDDNMQLILKRLDSIDNSMKILSVQPPPPWWVPYIPSRFMILSTLWPFIVNLILFYLWRRRRKRIRRKLAAAPLSWGPT